MKSCVAVAVVTVLVLLIAWLARSATWIYDPATDPAVVACIDACADQCGLVTGPPRPLDLTAIVCQRRRLAGEPVTCP